MSSESEHQEFKAIEEQALIGDIPNPCWYAVHTFSRQERKVEKGLVVKGIDTFLPKINRPSRKYKSVNLVDIPLFPGYLFVHTDLDVNYYNIIRQSGVVRILGYKKQWTPVPEDTIRNIEILIQSGRYLESWPSLEPGKKVRVVDGPLEGVSGVIIRRKNKKQRIVVGVELLGRSVSAELSEDVVELL